MRRFRFLFAILILLSWVGSRFLEYIPRFHEWWFVIDVGCILITIISILSALIWRRWSAFKTFSLLLAVLMLSGIGEFTYRLNYVCASGRTIRSETDAIELAKALYWQARYGSHGIPGYVDEKPGSVDFGQVDNCCTVTRRRTAFGVIVWEVSLHGETIGEPKKRYVDAIMSLSNCGAVFVDESFILAEPGR